MKPLAKRTIAKDLWTLGLQNLDVELTNDLELPILGKLPAGIEGTLYRIGPARFDVYGDRWKHWFDGDGMVHAIRIERGKAYYRNRFVATEAKKREDEAKQRLYGSFGTTPPGGALAKFSRREMMNRANTNVVHYAGKLFALWEGGRPYELDPKTLETKGESDLMHGLPKGATFSAHPKWHPSTGEAWNFGVSYGARPKIHLYKWKSDGKAEAFHSIPLPFPSMIHDFALSEHFAIFVIPPIQLPNFPWRMLMGWQSYSDALTWEPQRGTHLAIVNLKTKETRFCQTDAFMLFHTINAWDDGTTVTVDLCRYPDDSIMRYLSQIMKGRASEISKARPERLEIGRDGEVKRFALPKTSFEFPRVAVQSLTREHRRMYGVSVTEGEMFSGAPTSIDLSTNEILTAPMAPGEYAGECVPLYKSAGAGAENDVWLLTVVLNGDEGRSELRIYDGQDVTSPVIATLPLPHIVPFGFHGNWVPKTHR